MAVPQGVLPERGQNLLAELDTWRCQWESLARLHSKGRAAPLMGYKVQWCDLQSRWCEHYSEWVRLGRVTEAQRFLDRASASLYAFNALCGPRKQASLALASFLSNRSRLSEAMLETLKRLGPSCAPGPLGEVLAQLARLDADVDHANQGMLQLNSLAGRLTMSGVGLETRWNADNLRENLRIACSAPSLTAQRPSSPAHPAWGGPPRPDHR